MILIATEEEEFEELEFLQEPPKAQKRWNYMAPVLEAWKRKKEEFEGSEEEGEGEEEEEGGRAKGISLKVSTPTLSIEVTIGSENSDGELLKETEEVFERILKIGRKYHIL